MRQVRTRIRESRKPGLFSLINVVTVVTGSPQRRESSRLLLKSETLCWNGGPHSSFKSLEEFRRVNFWDKTLKSRISTSCMYVIWWIKTLRTTLFQNFSYTKIQFFNLVGWVEKGARSLAHLVLWKDLIHPCCYSLRFSNLTNDEAELNYIDWWTLIGMTKHF